MHTVTYYKFGHRWYLDDPDYLDQGGAEEDLERFGMFRDFLELAAEGETSVTFHMDTEPFEGADCFELVASTGGKTGGYYHLRHFQGAETDLEVWFNAVVFSRQSILPEKIYVKRRPRPQ